jgi:hypothetical protein
MLPQALRHMLDDTPHPGALRGARRTEDSGKRRAARHVIDVHRRKPALVMMRVPEGKLLAAMRRTERVVDVKDLDPTRLYRGAKLINESRAQPRRLVLLGAFSRRLIVDCEASAAPLCGQRPTAIFIAGSWRSRSKSFASS